MRIKLALEVPTSAASLFSLLHDYDQRARWDTFVPEAVLLDAATAARGVTVRCTDRFGLSMDTRYVGFQPPHLATVRMTRGPWPFSQLAGSWRIVEPHQGRCTLVVTYNLKTKPRFARPLLEPVVTALFWLQTWRRLRALSQFVGNTARATH